MCVSNKVLVVNLPYFPPHRFERSIVGPFTVSDQVECQVKQQNAVVQPHWYKHDEPRPSCSLVQPQDEQNQEDEADKPGAQRSVQHSHNEKLLFGQH